MSMPDPNLPPPPPPRPPSMGGCLSAILVLVGVVLLLPGICSLLVMTAGGINIGGDIAGLILLTFLISAGGIALIVYAARNR